MMQLTFFYLAQAAAPAAGQTGGGGGGMTMLVYMACLGVIMYFLMIRPQSQKQKQHDALVKSVKTGDKVVTSSGIHGIISNVKEATVLLKIADNVKIEVDKTSIGAVSKSSAAEASA